MYILAHIYVLICILSPMDFTTLGYNGKFHTILTKVCFLGVPGLQNTWPCSFSLGLEGVWGNWEGLNRLEFKISLNPLQSASIPLRRILTEQGLRLRLLPTGLLAGHTLLSEQLLL